MTTLPAVLPLNDSSSLGTVRKSPPETELADISEGGLKENPAFVARPQNKRLRPNVENHFDCNFYYVENGLRKVYPYEYTHHSYCKGRWINKKLVDLFTEEFKALTNESIQHRIERGLIKVNGQSIGLDYVLKSNDSITHRIHRHEFPVFATCIPIIHNDDEWLVIDKPPSLPVHPCGKYKLNSVLSLLQIEEGIEGVHVVHRLDRLTSGVMIMAKTKKRAQSLHHEMRNRQMHKEYVCRVQGQFPEGTIVCDQPIATLAHRIGICIVSQADGKPSSTSFQRLNYNGKSSTVLCKPLTGRMHQIRVHLQYLGFPIVNDTFYNSPAFGADRGKGGQYGKSLPELVKDVEADHDKNKYLTTSEPVNTDDEGWQRKNRVAIQALAHYTGQAKWAAMLERYKFDASRMTASEDCDECALTTRDPTNEEQFIYLHALRYKGIDWEFESTLPVWARDDWTHD